jgi:hypothetical protein
LLTSSAWGDSPAFAGKLLTYDANGNITQMVRMGETGSELAIAFAVKK